MLRKTIALLITLSATIGCSAAPDRGRLSRDEEILGQAIRELARATGDDDQEREVDPEAANPGRTTDSQRAEPSLVFEHEAECGNPVVESMAWSVLNGTAVRVTGGDAFVLRTSTGKRIEVGLVAVDTSRHQAPARELLSALIQGQAVTVLVNPSAAGKRRVVGVVQVDTRDVGRELLRAGVARFKEPPPYSVSTYTSCLYKITEREATGALGDNAPTS